MTGFDLEMFYSAKAVEYLIAVAYMLLFIPFWRYVNGGRAAEAKAEIEEAARVAPPITVATRGWFTVPEHVYLHPGHSWARKDDEDPDDVATIGLDDFGAKLVGRMKGIDLPALGTRLGQGERAFTLRADSKSVDMLSPLDGEVVAINGRIIGEPEAANDDPYGDGWFVKVRAPRLRANLNGLVSGDLARKLLDDETEGIRSRLVKARPDLGRVYEDGGAPVDGIARILEGEAWDRLAGELLLTADAAGGKS